ncbi:MAG: PEGA domain-containing protein [Desulfobacterales bacterium]|nr:PEGA domain-containing protein [Desulfobacterales bacterium]
MSLELSEELAKELIKRCFPQFEFGWKIGSGAFGSVFLIEAGYNQKKAVKVMEMLAHKSKGCSRATQLTKKLNNDFQMVKDEYENIEGEGVIKIDEFHLIEREATDREASAYLLVKMRYYEKSLEDFVIAKYEEDSNVSPELAKALMIQLATILNRLLKITSGKSKGFIVTDLKPSNLMIETKDDQINILIADLGGIKRIKTVMSDNKEYTFDWTAPEIFVKGEKPNELSMIYSYGMVSFFIWEGELPYPDENHLSRPTEIQNQGLKFERDDVPDNIKNLIATCLSREPENRPQCLDDIIKDLTSESKKRKKNFNQKTVISSERKAEIEAEERAKAKFGVLIVTSEPSDVDVILDGEPKGQSPLRIENVPIGIRILRLKAKTDYYKPSSQPIEISPLMENKVHVVMEKETGRLKVEAETFSKKYPARFYLDNSLSGIAPLQLEVGIGEHKYKFEANAHKSESGAITIKKDNEIKLSKTLTPLPGKTYICSDPEGALIYIDGKNTGAKTDNKFENIAAGRHKIKLELNGYEVSEDDVVIEPSGFVQKELNLKKTNIKIRRYMGIQSNSGNEVRIY